MRAVIQRVTSGSVQVDGSVVASIERGLVVLVGIGSASTHQDMVSLAKKLASIRLWPNEQGQEWRSCVKDPHINGELLLVSQFTLYAVMKGNKPDFHHAMPPAEAKDKWAVFVDLVKKERGQPALVKQGIFGANMNVSIQNDGPVTINLEYGGSAVKDDETEI